MNPPLTTQDLRDVESELIRKLRVTRSQAVAALQRLEAFVKKTHAKGSAAIAGFIMLTAAEKSPTKTRDAIVQAALGGPFAATLYPLVVLVGPNLRARGLRASTISGQ